MILCLLGSCFFVGTALMCRADDGYGHGPDCDDHEDGCGVTTTTTTTLDPTTTTLLDPGCPDPAPCPTVVCGGEGSTYQFITVNRCPEVKFPAYAPCRKRKNGTARDGDVIFQGKPYKCPRAGTPHRYFIPLS